jgi:hypothetical protein
MTSSGIESATFRPVAYVWTYYATELSQRYLNNKGQYKWTVIHETVEEFS